MATSTKSQHWCRYTRKELNISWSVKQKGPEQHLILKCRFGEYFFVVPKTWKFRKWSLASRNLAEVLAFWAFWRRDDLKQFISEDWTPWLDAEESTGDGDAKITPSPDLRRWNRRMEIDRTAISFSGGLDSCAIVPLLPPKKTIMVYMKRRIEKPTMLRHGQQLLAMNHIRKHYKINSFVIESDIELLAVKSIGRIGFPSEYACALPCAILADHSGITGICTGTIGLFLQGGTSYHDFSATKYYQFWTGLFAKAGIDLFWPVGGVVDKGTALICKKAGIPGQSCVRNDNGSCGRCFKCFRKNSLCMESGRALHVNPSTGRAAIPYDAKPKLRKKPLTLIELYQKGFLPPDSRLKKYKTLDLSYQSRYFPEVYEYMVPDRLRSYVTSRLDRFLGPMNETQIKTVKTLHFDAKTIKHLQDLI